MTQPERKSIFIRLLGSAPLILTVLVILLCIGMSILTGEKDGYILAIFVAGIAGVLGSKGAFSGDWE